MHDQLNAIIQQKLVEIENRKKELSSKSFKKAISTDSLAIIAEIKRKSPSKGLLAEIADPGYLAQQYVDGGAAAISVLTDEKFFAGSLNDLKIVADTLKNNPIPILRKDFIIDEIQIVDALLTDANAILLIVTVLQQRTVELLRFSHQLGLDVIVEVHNKTELEYALDMGADIIGINNRNLDTFEERLETCLELIEYIPPQVVSIAESAIRSEEDLSRIHCAGFNAVLIGEALVKSTNPCQRLQQMCEVVA